MSNDKKVQPNYIDYVDTTLIECSRLQSSNRDIYEPGSNGAIFQNDQSPGIQINEGDKISMQSAFVSEVGAGSETIEFTGKPKTSSNPNEVNFYFTLTAKRNIDFENNTASFLVDNYNPYELEYENQIQYRMNDSILHCIEEWSEDLQQFTAQDNVLNFQLSYYKTTNGENYFHLPRRWANGATYGDIARLYQYGNSNATDQALLAAYQCIYLNKSWLSFPYPYTGTSVYEAQYEVSGQIVDDATLAGKGCPQVWQVCPADYHIQPYILRNYNEANLKAPNITKKNDNSKYKIYVRTRTQWFPRTNDGVMETYQSIMENLEYDIALNDYIPYVELKRLEVDVGFDTPSNIATNLTEQLNKIVTDKPLKYRPTNKPDNSYVSGIDSKDVAYSRITESECFKAFKSATESSFNPTSSRRFFCGNEDNGTTENGAAEYLYNQSTLNYFNSFHYIGVKRPEVYDRGNKIKGDTNGDPINLKQSIDFTDTNPTIVTTLKWDDVNPTTDSKYLVDFKKLFDAQKIYPELFEYTGNFEVSYNPETGVSVDRNRYIHMQNKNRTAGTFVDVLGNDNWLYPEDNTANRNQYSGAMSNGAVSNPIFISYDPEQEDNQDYDVNGSNRDNLWGGFAFRTKIAGEDYITFKLNNAADWTEEMFDVSGIINAGERSLGYDRHWSAYGTSCIALYSGKSAINFTDFKDGVRYGSGFDGAFDNTAAITYLPLGGATQDRIMDLGSNLLLSGFDMYPFIYLGAPEPIINFDTQINRFTIGGLYSPEYIGNHINAGVKYKDNPFPAADTPDQQVYYINKQLKCNSFCPDMVPYNTSFKRPGATYAPADVYTETYIVGPNRNLDHSTIYDKHSGVSWDSFGPITPLWEQDTLLGILGFDRTILIDENAQNNFQTNFFQDVYKPSLNVGITNSALVKNSDILARSNNLTTKPLFNYLLPSDPQYNILLMAEVLNNATLPEGFLKMTNINNNDTEWNIIVQNTSTSVIKATNLPKKTTRPYYLIRSDIIKQDNFVAAKGNILPVIGIVNKINGDADFYSTETEGTEFTATKDYVIKSIKTSIHQPNGELAVVDSNSAVIYKIQRNKKIITNLDEVMLS